MCRARVVLTLLVLVTTVACDQTTKRWARDALVEGDSVSLLKGHVHLLRVENPGAFLSLGSDLPGDLRIALFVLLVGAGLLAALLWLFRAPKGSWWEMFALSLVIAGGASNLFDRVLRHGAVTDFLLLTAGPLRTGIFNVADVVITAGVVLLLIHRVIARKGGTGRSPSPHPR